MFSSDIPVFFLKDDTGRRCDEIKTRKCGKTKGQSELENSRVRHTSNRLVRHCRAVLWRPFGSTWLVGVFIRPAKAQNIPLVSKFLKKTSHFRCIIFFCSTCKVPLRRPWARSRPHAALQEPFVAAHCSYTGRVKCRGHVSLCRRVQRSLCSQRQITSFY